MLEQVSPKQSDVACSTALQYPDQNRFSKFLPGECDIIIIFVPAYILSSHVCVCVQLIDTELS